jgi:hypothetical protein
MKTSAPSNLSGAVPEYKIIGTSGLILFISPASKAPVVVEKVVGYRGAYRGLAQNPQSLVRRGRADDVIATLLQECLSQGQVSCIVLNAQEKGLYVLNRAEFS